MSSAFALPYHCNRMWQPIGSTFPTSHAPFPFALDVAVSSHAVKVRFVEVSSPSRNLRTCFKKQGMIPRCCGFVNPQRATSQGRGWVSQPIGLGNQAPTIDLTRFAEYGDNTPLNSGRPSGLVKKPSFEEKTRFHGK